MWEECDMKEYIFRCGNYRHFIITASNEEEAIKRFKEASLKRFGTMGFKIKDVTKIEEICRLGGDE